MSLQEISAAEEMMKMAINNQNHVDSLIGYYRDLIDSYNNERAQWVLHYDNVNTTAGDQYLLEKQLGHAKVELSDLHQQLALKKAELTAERQKYFKLLENNGNIKKRLQESKSNYRELMNSCKPVGLNNNKFSNSSILGASRQDNSKISVPKQNPNSKSTQLQLQLINTSKEHAQKKSKLKSEIDGLKAQLNTLMREFDDRQQANSSEYQRSLNKLSDLQNKYMTLTSEYFRYRTTNSIQQKKTQQQNEILRLKNLSLIQKLKSLEKEHSQQYNNVEAVVKKQNKKFKQKYDEELKKKQEHLTILKQQHERIQDIYLNKIKKLEEELRNTNQKLKITDDKAKVEVGSLKSQIKILRGRLEKQGLHQLRKEIANEDDQSSQSLEISDLEKINQEVKNLQRQLNAQK